LKAFLLGNLSEAKFQEMVIRFAKLNKWACAHFRTTRIQRKNGAIYYATPVQADGAGLPDLFLVRDRAMWAELKTDTGILSPDQQAWIDSLKKAGQEVYVWRPRDWNQIVTVLS
jgi:VRR-NUC domain